MSVSGAKAKLALVSKELAQAWWRLREEWNDPASRTIEKRYLEPLEGQVKSAITAMEKMGQVLATMRRECGPS